LFIGVVDTGKKFIVGIVVTVSFFSAVNGTGEQLSPVSTTPPINFLPLSTTLLINLSAVSTVYQRCQ
jgi:hypothetical protein